MKKFNNKKGFTIVELVIVIAVIGILAGVLIPTFSGIVQRANESKINQEMTNALKVVLAGNATSGALANGTTFVMSQKNDENKDVAAYYAEYNGNKFEKIVTINKDNSLNTTGFDRVIIGTDKNKNNNFYEATVNAINNLYNLTDEKAGVKKTANDVNKIGSLTVLTNSDLSEGMFVLVPADNNNSTVEKVNLTLNLKGCTSTTSNGQINKNAELVIEFKPDEINKTISANNITVQVGSSTLEAAKFTIVSNKLTISGTEVTGDVVITVEVN